MTTAVADEKTGKRLRTIERISAVFWQKDEAESIRWMHKGLHDAAKRLGYQLATEGIAIKHLGDEVLGIDGIFHVFEVSGFAGEKLKLPVKPNFC